VLRVCPNCSRRGTPINVSPTVPHSTAPHLVSANEAAPELEVDPEYDTIVKHAREKLGLTQEALGRMINVKPSVISHVETRKLKPDFVLARTLMHSLKVNLLVASSDLESDS
jgi:uncharacterized protein (TIGR00270 family)